jgi:hypothetical protein
METLGGIIGAVVGLAIGAYFRDKYPAQTKFAKLLQFVAIIAVAAVAGGAAGIGQRYLRTAVGSPSKADLDQATQTIRQFPLLGLVISENPALESKVREAAEAELRDPTKNGPDRLWRVGADIRQQYVHPALCNTDDVSAANAIRALQQLAVYLQAKDVSACNELGKIGLPRPDKLDSEGAAMFKRLLAAQETAYRNGRTAGARARPTDEEAGQMLLKAGYTQQDFEHLSHLENLSDADGCSATVKLLSAPQHLPTSSAGNLARYLLTVTQ